MAAVIRRREHSSASGDAAVAKGGDKLPDNLPDDTPALLRRVLLARGLNCAEDIDCSLQGLLSPEGLLGIDKACALLVDALQKQARILVVGDYDADGATSSALALRALARFGHRDVRFMVPNRFEFGYGLSPEIVAMARQQAPALIITVDNGISSVEGVRAARAAGIDVLITDHHLAGSELPAANAIVNPNQPGCHFASKALAGVGVIFYVMLALRAILESLDWFSEAIPKPNMAEFLDLVALGTVADVVPLDRNNRILVEQGLRRIRRGQASAGIRALIDSAGKRAATLSASDLGFALGPRLNAAGRLDDISIGIGCLLTDDPGMAAEIASELDDFNRNRQQIEQSMQVLAAQQLELLRKNSELNGEALPSGLCLYNDNWHQGVVGILASRIKESYHRPVLCFAPASESADCSELKGSARSIQGFHIRDALDAIASQNPGLVEKFGGHAMAAGLTLARDNFARFAQAFEQYAAAMLGEEQLQAVLWSDGELAVDEINIDNARLMRAALPWGQKLPEPLFDGVFDILEQRLVGERHLKLLLESRRDAIPVKVEAIAFNIDLEQWPDQTASRVRIAYTLDVNAWRGREQLQLLVRHIEKYSANA
ncbi:MAG: single-stranded-DNA-specific exonuclease RecJ [Pseudomonadales bacterium]